MSKLPEEWSGHAPDLVRDNRLMHERIAEQDRELERLRAQNERLGRDSPALHLVVNENEGLRRALCCALCNCGNTWSEDPQMHFRACPYARPDLEAEGKHLSETVIALAVDRDKMRHAISKAVDGGILECERCGPQGRRAFTISREAFEALLAAVGQL